MSISPHLQHLLFDPERGYLYPHSRTLAAMGVSQYTLTRCRSQLVEGEDWLKMQCSDNIVRVFYTLRGLQALASLVATSEAQAFWVCVDEAIACSSLVYIAPARSYTEPEEPEEFVSDTVVPDVETTYRIDNTAALLVQTQRDFADLMAKVLSSQPAITVNSHPVINPLTRWLASQDQLAFLVVMILVTGLVSYTAGYASSRSPTPTPSQVPTQTVEQVQR
jgi:hypothetical protein